MANTSQKGCSDRLKDNPATSLQVFKWQNHTSMWIQYLRTVCKCSISSFRACLLTYQHFLKQQIQQMQLQWAILTKTVLVIVQCIFSMLRNMNFYGLLLLISSSHHTFSSGENYRLLFLSAFEQSVDYAGAAVRHPQTSLSWLATRWHKATSHASESQFSAPSRDPWTATIQRNEKPKRAWT